MQVVSGGEHSRTTRVTSRGYLLTSPGVPVSVHRRAVPVGPHRVAPDEPAGAEAGAGHQLGQGLVQGDRGLSEVQPL